MKLFIVLTAFQRGSSYGFEEYISNVLRYMASHIDDINVDEKVILCRLSQVNYFKTLTMGCFSIIGVKSNSLIDRRIAPVRAI